jgi:hypothetical protein
VAEFNVPKHPLLLGLAKIGLLSDSMSDLS